MAQVRGAWAGAGGLRHGQGCVCWRAGAGERGGSWTWRRRCACSTLGRPTQGCLLESPVLRFAYTGYKSYGSKGSGQGGNSTAVSLPAPECDYNVDENDAMETIYAWLHSRIPHTRGPQAEAEQQQSGTSKQPSGSKKASRKEAAEPVEVE